MSTRTIAVGGENLVDFVETGTGDGIPQYAANPGGCLLYTSPSPRDGLLSRMPSSA